MEHRAPEEVLCLGPGFVNSLVKIDSCNPYAFIGTKMMWRPRAYVFIRYVLMLGFTAIMGTYPGSFSQKTIIGFFLPFLLLGE